MPRQSRFSDFEFSEPEDLSWEEVQRFKLPFGKHKGEALKTVMRSKEGRDYLRYLLNWDALKEGTRSKIQAGLQHYALSKASR